MSVAGTGQQKYSALPHMYGVCRPIKKGRARTRMRLRARRCLCFSTAARGFGGLELLGLCRVGRNSNGLDVGGVDLGAGNLAGAVVDRRRRRCEAGIGRKRRGRGRGLRRCCAVAGLVAVPTLDGLGRPAVIGGRVENHDQRGHDEYRQDATLACAGHHVLRRSFFVICTRRPRYERIVVARRPRSGAAMRSLITRAARAGHVCQAIYDARSERVS